MCRTPITEPVTRVSVVTCQHSVRLSSYFDFPPHSRLLMVWKYFVLKHRKCIEKYQCLKCRRVVTFVKVLPVSRVRRRLTCRDSSRQQRNSPRPPPFSCIVLLYYLYMSHMNILYLYQISWYVHIRAGALCDNGRVSIPTVTMSLTLHIFLLYVVCHTQTDFLQRSVNRSTALNYPGIDLQLPIMQL